MASTSLKNLPGQYCREQTEQLNKEYLVLKEKKVPAVSKLPDFGINAGNIAGAYTHGVFQKIQQI